MNKVLVTPEVIRECDETLLILTIKCESELDDNKELGFSIELECTQPITLGGFEFLAGLTTNLSTGEEIEHEDSSILLDKFNNELEFTIHEEWGTTYTQTVGWLRAEIARLYTLVTDWQWCGSIKETPKKGWTRTIELR